MLLQWPSLFFLSYWCAPPRAAAMCEDQPRLWSPAARWVLERRLSNIKQSVDLFYNGIQRLPSKSNTLGAFWRETLYSWKALGGKAKIQDGPPGPHLAYLPLSHPQVSSHFAPSLRARRAILLLGIRTPYDLFKVDERSGLIKTPDDPRYAPIIRDILRGYISLTPALKASILQIRSNSESIQPPPMLELAAVKLCTYRPQIGRRYTDDPSEEPIGIVRWRRGQDDIPIHPARWTDLFKTKLEPKHLSLMWRLRHGSVATARQLCHMVPELDDKCPICRDHTEDLVHYFHECARVKRFWTLVSQFLTNRCTDVQTNTKIDITLKQVIYGFGEWVKIIPNANALYGLAVWEIYRAHAEASLDNKIVSADSLFCRWKLTVMERIVHDYFAMYQLQSGTFQSHWCCVECQWFLYDPGGPESSSTLSFSTSPFDPDHPDTSHAISFTHKHIDNS